MSTTGPDSSAPGAREVQLAAVAQHLIALAESEKAELARHLHGELGACLTVMALDISIVAEKLKHGEPELAVRLQRALGKIKEAVGLKRQLIDGLRPPMLEHLGLSACLEEHVAGFGQRTGLQMSTDICRDFDGIDGGRAIAMFRTVQQALDNVERHAGAGRVWLSLLEEEGRMLLFVEDDGVGIAAGLLEHRQSIGLAVMREHLALHGGGLSLRGRPQGSGTVLEAWLPAG